jgi:hypothetical protein
MNDSISDFVEGGLYRSETITIAVTTVVIFHVAKMVMLLLGSAPQS